MLRCLPLTFALLALLTVNAVQYLFLNFSAIVPIWTWLAKPIGNSDSCQHLFLFTRSQERWIRPA